MLRDPAELLPCELIPNLGLHSSVLRFLLDLKMDDVVNVCPNKVLLLNVLVEPLAFLVKCALIQIANETVVKLIIVSLLLLVSQLGKSVNNDTKDNVHQNRDDRNLECHAVSKPRKVL